MNSNFIIFIILILVDNQNVIFFDLKFTKLCIKIIIIIIARSHISFDNEA